MEYYLSVGLSFEMVATTLQPLRDKEPEFTNPVSPMRFMLWWYLLRAIDLVEET